MNHSDSSPSLQQHAAATAASSHKSFELVTFVDKLPLLIECLACYENILILGLSTGRILIYEAKIDPTPPLKLEASFEKSIAVTKKPIQQIEVSKEFGVLVALFDSQIHVFDLRQYALEYSLPKTKNCSLFALSLSRDSRTLRMCVACKKRLQFFYASRKTSGDDTPSNTSKFMELASDLELTDTPRTLEFTRDNLVVFSLRKEFFYYELPSSSATTRAPESRFSNGTRIMDPLCHKLYNDSFVVGIDENKTILYDPSGRPSLDYPVMWSGSPSVVTAVGFYLVGIVPTLNCVEVVTFEPEAVSVQLVDTAKELSIPLISTSASLGSSHSGSLLTSRLMDNMSSLTQGIASSVGGGGSSSGGGSGADRLKFLKSNGNSICYVANQNNVWCLVPVKHNDQLEQVLLHKNYSLGLSLIACQRHFNESSRGLKEDSSVETKANLLKPFFSLKWLSSETDENLERKIRNLSALELFRRKRFKESFVAFLDLRTDPTHLIAFLPGLLPEQFRAELAFDQLYVDFNPKEQEDAIDALIDYLNSKRKEFIKLPDQQPLNLIPLIDGRSVIKLKQQVLQIIDTTLLKCYLKSKENLVQVFLRIHPNFLHLKESERLLIQHNKLSELIILYERKEAHEKALTLLMAESNKSNSTLAGLKHLVEYLNKLGNKNLELVFKYAKYVIERDLERGMKIFFSGEPTRVDELLLRRANQMAESLSRPKSGGQQQAAAAAAARRPFAAELDLDDDDVMRELDHERVVRFFDTLEPPELAAYLTRVYLQYCVYVWTDKTATLSNLLIDVYKRYVEGLWQHVPAGVSLTALREATTYRKLLKLLLSEAASYELSFALSRLDLDEYPEERAIVLGRMGKHHEALSIYVNKLNEPDKAEAYCNYIYTQHHQQDVYYELLQIYLQSDYEEIRLDGSVSLLNAHSAKIGTSRTLEMLPAQLMKCKNLSQFFETMLYRLVRTKHDTQIRQKLMIALQLQVHETKIISQDKKFVVTDEQICVECNKRLGRSALVRFPNGVLIHYGCLKSYDTTASTVSSAGS